jgi:SAM-dependent methyltransferase
MAIESTDSSTSSSRSSRYDEIGRFYGRTRREDSRIAAQIRAALGSGGPLLNVGAGTGNYEPADRTVVAVDPSARMLAQRQRRSRLVVRGIAERRPFPDGAFCSALAIFTMQHWDDREAGLRELRRVSKTQFISFYQPTEPDHLWIVDYFDDDPPPPERPSKSDVAVVHECLKVREVRTVLVPHDCTDGFGAAFWARPEAYLDPVVQAGISELANLSNDARARWTARLASDLESGEWDRCHGHLRSMTEYDVGYRLAIAES